MIFSLLNGKDLNNFFKKILQVKNLSGSRKKAIPSEKISRLNARRSIVLNIDVKKRFDYKKISLPKDLGQV